MKIWKLSLGTGEFNDVVFKKMLENNVVSVYPDTKAKGQSSKSQGENFLEAKRGDLFFLCRSNNSIELVGMFKDNFPLDAMDSGYANDGWVDREFILINKAVNSKGYNKKFVDSNGKQPWWHPGDNSTFIEVKDLKLFENEILKPVFSDLSIQELIHSRKNKLQFKERLIMSNTNTNKIEQVGCLTIEELFKKNLRLPIYQRPYLWEIKQVENLLRDFLEIEKNDTTENEKIYLIGNMIFHYKDENLEIVDGQQRTVTIALLLYNLENESNEFLDGIEIDNPLSKQAIYDNNMIIQNFIDRFLNDVGKKDKFLNFIKKNILITYIVANTLDEAFIFFDSQNTRGKPLNRHDLLKAHHLRDKNLDSTKRIAYARIWQEYEEEKLKKLLEVYLTLSRNFVKGNYKFDTDVYEEFKSNNFSNILNNYNQPPIFKSVSFDVESKKLKLNLKDDLEFKIGNGLVFDNAEKYLPFEVIQSIGGGEEFFWYISKYIGLKDKFDELLNNNIISTVDALSLYLREYFYALTFLYYDKFGDDKFEEFCYLVLWLVSHYRLNNYSVRYLGVRNFVRDSNIFVKLFFSYASSEIIEKINTYIKYDLHEIDNDAINKGIRKTYFNKIKSDANLNQIAKLVKG